MLSKSRILLSLAVVGLLSLPTALMAQKAPSGSPAVDPPSICDAISGNLVANCGFETGNFTGWTTVAASSGSLFGVTSDAAFVNSGSFGAFFGAVGTTDDSISQVISDNAGGTYTLSFWLNNLATAPGQANFSVFWDGTDIFNASSSAFPYTQFSFTVTGTGSDTLQFSSLQVPSYYSLDDVAVVGTPEPTSLSLLSAGLLAFGALLLFSRRLTA